MDGVPIVVNSGRITKKVIDIRDIMSYCITFVGVMSFLVPLIAFKHDKKDVNDTGIINTIFMILSIGFPYIYFIFSIIVKEVSFTIRLIMFLIILGLSGMNLYVLIMNQNIKADKIQYEFIINFGVGMLLFSIILYKANTNLFPK